MKNKFKFVINNFKSLIVFVFVFMMLVLPALSLAQESKPIVPPCPDEGCGFKEFIDLINNVIEFILFKMAIPIAAIMFAYAGFLMVTAGGEAAHARQEAKEIAMNTVIGLIFAAAAFLIVKTILSILGYTDASWIGF
jgi:hypothetical protein